MAGVKFVGGVGICVSVFRVVIYDPGIFLSSENVYVLSYDIYHKLVVISISIVVVYEDFNPFF